MTGVRWTPARRCDVVLDASHHLHPDLLASAIVEP
jgi:hypothetical protein